MSIPSKARRTCRECSPPQVFRSLTALREHRMTEHPELHTDSVPRYNNRVADTEILAAIRKGTRALVRGPTGPELMQELGFASKRSVYERLKRLKAAGLVVDTNNEGYALTPAGQIAIATKGAP